MSPEAREPVRLTNWHVAAALLVIVGGALGLRECRRPKGAAPEAQVPAVTEEAATPAAPAAGELPRRQVTLCLPAADAPALREIPGEIFATSALTDQVKQLVGQVLKPPTSPGVVAPFPAGTALRSLFLDRQRGIAYVSLSREAAGRATQGSEGERLAVHALVGSIVRSFPEVKRVQLLLEGQEVEALPGGHLALSEPLLFDSRLVASAP